MKRDLYVKKICLTPFAFAHRVELYADGLGSGAPVVVGAILDGTGPGTTSVYRYLASVATARPAEHFTPRVVPFHREALVPVEQQRITWAR